MADSLRSNSLRRNVTYYGISTKSTSYNGTAMAMSNDTIMMATGIGCTTNRQYQRESDGSSKQVGFFLLTLGSFACAIFFTCATFLYLIKSRYVHVALTKGMVISLLCSLNWMNDSDSLLLSRFTPHFTCLYHGCAYYSFRR